MIYVKVISGFPEKIYPHMKVGEIYKCENKTNSNKFIWLFPIGENKYNTRIMFPKEFIKEIQTEKMERPKRKKD